MLEPKIGEIITVEGVKYITKLAVNPDKLKLITVLSVEESSNEQTINC